MNELAIKTFVVVVVAVCTMLGLIAVFLFIGFVGTKAANAREMKAMQRAFQRRLEDERKAERERLERIANQCPKWIARPGIIPGGEIRYPCCLNRGHDGACSHPRCGAPK